MLKRTLNRDFFSYQLAVTASALIRTIRDDREFLSGKLESAVIRMWNSSTEGVPNVIN